MPRNFAPAAPSEQTVYGACRPCHPGFPPADDTIDEWLQFMIAEGIDRVCCLLDDRYLEAYEELLAQYRDTSAQTTCVTLRSLTSPRCHSQRSTPGSSRFLTRQTTPTKPSLYTAQQAQAAQDTSSRCGFTSAADLDLNKRFTPSRTPGGTRSKQRQCLNSKP